MLNFIMHMYFELFCSIERSMEINYMLPHAAPRSDPSKLEKLVILSDFSVSLVLVRPSLFHTRILSAASHG